MAALCAAPGQAPKSNAAAWLNGDVSSGADEKATSRPSPGATIGGGGSCQGALSGGFSVVELEKRLLAEAAASNLKNLLVAAVTKAWPDAKGEAADFRVQEAAEEKATTEQEGLEATCGEKRHGKRRGASQRDRSRYRKRGDGNKKSAASRGGAAWDAAEHASGEYWQAGPADEWRSSNTSRHQQGWHAGKAKANQGVANEQREHQQQKGAGKSKGQGGSKAAAAPLLRQEGVTIAKRPTDADATTLPSSTRVASRPTPPQAAPPAAKPPQQAAESEKVKVLHVPWLFHGQGASSKGRAMSGGSQEVLHGAGEEERKFAKKEREAAAEAVSSIPRSMCGISFTILQKQMDEGRRENDGTSSRLGQV
eukprot:TRINITY_DN7669_c0_g2_i1.p1 TRINITY_DN7669_c0_g2~~TRINITY_DN7669_c0_g2_i1.p1  ORF type:complete len:366 (-),score=118.92 TRINITY_DN7669_c0_g2_i1:582-1679(-)